MDTQGTQKRIFQNDLGVDCLQERQAVYPCIDDGKRLDVLIVKTVLDNRTGGQW